LTESAAGSAASLAAGRRAGGAGPLRVPRHVRPRTLLRRYDPLESLGRALLYHTRPAAPFRSEAFAGCVRLAPAPHWLFAVVTSEHLLLLACRAGPGGPLFRRPALQRLLQARDVLAATAEGPRLRLLCLPPWDRSPLHPAAAHAGGSAAASSEGGGRGPDASPLAKWFVACTIECGTADAAARVRQLLLSVSEPQRRGAAAGGWLG
ncbi:hypothetical protein MNEG_13403, partial [Monoraphidium neglectum]